MNIWNKFLYALLFVWVKVHALFPLRVLYVLSDILYFLIYKVVGYRRDVVRHNLKASFPHKSKAERLDLERRFYHHFCDYVVETLKMAHISQRELNQRAFIENPEVIDHLMDQGHDCLLLLMGHCGNWEWYAGSTPYFHDATIYQIYRPLKNQAVDRLFIYLRTRFGSKGIKKNDTLRDLVRIRRSRERSVVIFLADQTPSRANLHFWTHFLNQETAFLTGPERIARKLDLPVVFLHVRPVKRGRYTLHFELVTENPRNTHEGNITARYAYLLEGLILQAPEQWLWTHKRWKYRPEDAPSKEASRTDKNLNT